MEELTKYQKDWQTIAMLAQELINLKNDYNFRKSKLIRFKPTEKELREASGLYKFALDLIDIKEHNAIELKKILDKVSPIIEEQIKYLGFVDEVTRKYQKDVPNTIFLDIAEKWGVLDYIFEDIVIAMGIRLEFLVGDEYARKETRKET